LIASVRISDPPGGSYTASGWRHASITLDAASFDRLGFVLWNDDQCDDASPQQRAMVLLDDVRLTAVPDSGSTGPLLAGTLAFAMLCCGADRGRRA
jgi:hypothetical protein